MQGLIFDWDNTLVDTIPAIKQSVIDTLDEFSFNGNREEIIAMAGFNLSLREGFPIVFGDNWQQAGEYYYRRYADNQKLIKKMLGFDELIAYLSDSHIPLAVNSNKAQHLLNAELQKFELTDLFNIAIGSGSCENDKPAPDGVYKICEYWNIKPSKDIYYIGDSLTDKNTADNSGLSFIQVLADNKAVKNLQVLLNLIVKK